MPDPKTTREVLLAEALGEAGELLQRIDGLVPIIDESARTLKDADQQMRATLVALQDRVAGIKDQATRRPGSPTAVSLEEAMRRSVQLHARAMTDAARMAFGAEIGATLQRLQSTHQSAIPRWRCGLMLLAVAMVVAALSAAVASALTLRLACA